MSQYVSTMNHCRVIENKKEEQYFYVKLKKKKRSSSLRIKHLG